MQVKLVVQQFSASYWEWLTTEQTTYFFYSIIKEDPLVSFEVQTTISHFY